MLALVVIEGVAILLLGLLVAGLLRSHAEILRALHDLGAGVDDPSAVRRQPQRDIRSASTADFTTDFTTDGAANDVVGLDLLGAATSVAVAGARHDTLLAFLSTGCSTCQPFWSALRSGADLPGDTRVVVVVQDEESESRLRDLAGADLEVVASNEAWQAYQVPGSPHFVYVDGPAGRVTGEGTGPDWPSVRALLLQAHADRAARGATGSTTADVEWRDNPTRIDSELAQAGIAPGHPSLDAPPDHDLGR
jgi:hypothetical protein